MPRGPKLSELTKRAICSDYSLNPNRLVLAKKFKVHPATISRTVKEMQTAPIKPEIVVHSSDWKQELNELAVSSVRRALVDGSDVYKSAAVAQTHLKGTGQYDADEKPKVSIGNLLVALPASLSDLFVTPSATPAIDVTASTDDSDT